MQNSELLWMLVRLTETLYSLEWIDKIYETNVMIRKILNSEL